MQTDILIYTFKWCIQYIQLGNDHTLRSNQHLRSSIKAKKDIEKRVFFKKYIQKNTSDIILPNTEITYLSVGGKRRENPTPLTVILSVTSYKKHKDISIYIISTRKHHQVRINLTVDKVIWSSLSAQPDFSINIYISLLNPLTTQHSKR